VEYNGVVTSPVEQALRVAGLRVTVPRHAALQLLLEGGHWRADEMAVALRGRLGTVSTQAVYDVLRALVGAGLARCIEPAGSVALYEARVGDNHHHLVCRSCRAVVDVACSAGDAPCLEPAERHGFDIDEAEVTYWGICPACRQDKEAKT